LNAVYGLVAWWAAEGREIDRVRRALCLMRLTTLGVKLRAKAICSAGRCQSMSLRCSLNPFARARMRRRRALALRCSWLGAI
jgi:hypothetical protein